MENNQAGANNLMVIPKRLLAVCLFGATGLTVSCVD